MFGVAIPPGLRESWAFFVHLAITLVPLFVGAAFLVGLADEYLPPSAVEQRLERYDGGTGNVAAAGLGAVTPFCSCSTVPVLSGLLQAGAPLGLAFSFLLASPLVNEVAILLLLGWFGLEVTVYYVVATFTAAVVGGLAIGALGLGDHVKDVSLGDDAEAVATDGGMATDGETTNACGCGAVDVERSHRQRVRAAAGEAWTFLRDMLPYLMLGMAIGALVHAVVPTSLLQAILGPENPLAVPLAALAGAPVYLSMSSMVPIAASLHGHGIAFGTVLAFVVGGAGVSLPNLVLLNKLFDRRLLAVYAGTVVTIGVAVGVLFNVLLV